MKEGSVGLLTADRSLIVRSWDTWIAQATGLGTDAACGNPLTDLYPEIERRGFVPLLRRVLDEGAVSVLAPAFHGYLIPCPPVHPSPYFEHMQQRVTISPLRSADSIEGIIIQVEDVTARRDEERRFGERLSSGDEATRLEAVREVAESSSRADLLSEAFGDRSWRVRRTAAQAAAHDASETAADVLIGLLRERHRDLSVLNAAIAAAARSRAHILPRLLPLLQEPDEDLRNYVALVLGLLGKPDAVPHLVSLLGDESLNVRFHALEALGRIADLRTVEAILPVAQSADFFLTPAACEALAAIGDEGVVPHLLPLLEDPMLAPVALDAIARLGGEEAVGPVTGTLAAGLAGIDDVAIALAAIHERASGRGGADAIPALARTRLTSAPIAELIRGYPSAVGPARRAIVRVAAWIDAPGVEDLLVRALEDVDCQLTAVEGLIARRSRAVGALAPRLEQLEPAATAAAIIALGRIGSTSAIPALVDLLDRRPELAVTIAAALGAIGAGQALEPLLDLIGSADPAVRQAAVGALNSIGHPEMPGRMARLVASASPYVRESAARISCYFGFPGAIDAVFELTRDPVESVRRTSVEHLATFDDPRVEGRLREVLLTDTPAVRAAAARSLALLGTEASADLAILALDDADLWVRYHAARSVASIDHPRVLERLREVASRDPVVPVRVAAIGALAAHADPAAEALLLEMTDAGSDPDLVRGAIGALLRIRTPEAEARIVEVIRGGPAEARAALLDVEGATPSPAVAAALLELVESSDDRSTLAAAMKMLLRSESAASFLPRLLLRASRAAGREIASRRVILETAAAEPRFLPDIAALLGSEDPHLRFVALEVLARADHPGVGSLIASAVADGSLQVRRFAALLLERLDLRQAVSLPDSPAIAIRPAAEAE